MSRKLEAATTDDWRAASENSRKMMARSEIKACGGGDEQMRDEDADGIPLSVEAAALAEVESCGGCDKQTSGEDAKRAHIGV
jgi:hypothetical protein